MRWSTVRQYSALGLEGESKLTTTGTKNHIHTKLEHERLRNVIASSGKRPLLRALHDIYDMPAQKSIKLNSYFAMMRQKRFTLATDAVLPDCSRRQTM